MEKTVSELPFHLWLSKINGVNDEGILKLLAYYESPSKIYYADNSEINALCEIGVLTGKQAAALKSAKSRSDIYTPFKAMTDKNIRIIPIDSPEYPAKLKNRPEAPAYIFSKGKLPSGNKPSVAIVGTREASSYGRSVSEYFASELAKMGVEIISGMARGIDGISQRAALNAGGTSFGVLGCGADVCYPIQNRDLYDSLCERGGIISPFPPETKPMPFLFPLRNRVISGLADAVLVTEARVKSGSKITVDFALEQGVDVLAVPGRITDAMSAGTNDLINQGAGIADCLDTVLVYVYGEKVSSEKPWDKVSAKLSALKDRLPLEQFEIIEILEDTPKGFDDICKEARKRNPNLSVGRLRSLLTELCIDGYVTDEAGGFARCL